MKPLPLLAAVLAVIATASSVLAHCQIPCGVYTDEMRFTMIEEDLQTIEKAMAAIKEASAADSVDHAAITRWTVNKEKHASSIQEIVSVYFMTQRIKPTADQYSEKLQVLHAMLISAMKCKQTLDPAHVATTRDLSAKFHALYFGQTASAAVHDDHSGHDHDSVAHVN